MVFEREGGGVFSFAFVYFVIKISKEVNQQFSLW